MKPGCAAVGTVLWLTACSIVNPHPDWVEHPSPEAVGQVLSGTAILGHPVSTDELPRYDLFGLNPTLLAAADDLKAEYRSPIQRAEALHQQLLSPTMVDGFGIEYRIANETLPPLEAFEARQVNCLSYTLMYVAMARRMGLSAKVNDVRLPPAWDLRDRDSLMLLRHVNAKIELRSGDELVIDLEMERYNPAYSQSLVSGDQAESLFYSNRAMELLARGEMDNAFLHLRRALELDSDKSYIWNNFGNLYFRSGHLDKAEIAYLQGLHINPGDLSVMSNLHALYTVRGEAEQAAYFQQRARKYRQRNPYWTYTRALAALDDGQLREAESLALKAIDGFADEPRFYVLAAQVYERLGDNRKATHMQRQAEEIRAKLYL